MEIRPYSKNAKKHPSKQVEQIANSIKEFGMNQQIVVDKDGVIIVGHGRYEALKKLGMEVKDEYIKVVDLTEEQAKAYRLADNKLNESEWDTKLILDEMSELSLELAKLTGFSDELTLDDEVELKPVDIHSAFEVVVECSDELDQQQIYEDLISKGLTCRLLTL